MSLINRQSRPRKVASKGLSAARGARKGMSAVQSAGKLTSFVGLAKTLNQLRKPKRREELKRRAGIVAGTGLAAIAGGMAYYRSRQDTEQQAPHQPTTAPAASAEGTPDAGVEAATDAGAASEADAGVTSKTDAGAASETDAGVAHESRQT